MPQFVADRYVCAMHTGFSATYRRGDGGHFPPLAPDVPCDRCVPWDILCPEWAEEHDYSVRCMLEVGHPHAHLSDFRGGDRRAWMREPVRHAEKG